mmetsp:Transcript_12923/g.31950  ORF Transcript_12923/g.31950 Transcript_12923/m.31950 type:complete len:343 (+) Transcript_12923:540-1568(+)
MDATDTPDLAAAKAALLQSVPQWSHLSRADIRLRPLSGGITNLVFRADAPADSAPGAAALLRIYGRGTQRFFDRAAELARFARLADRGLGPRLLGSYPWGRVEEFLPARPMEAEEIRRDGVARKIAHLVARLHLLEPTSDDQEGWEWRLCKWLAELGDDVSLVGRAREGLQLVRARLAASSGGGALDEAKAFCDELVFCHNDLLGANILVADGGRGDCCGAMHVIDYEYASLNPRGYDLANHFCEYAGFETDCSQYPSRGHQMAFVRAYCAELDPGRSVSEQFLNAVVQRLVIYAMASDLFWGTWGLLQARHSNLEFDFAAYAHRRLNQMLDFHVNLLTPLP